VENKICHDCWYFVSDHNDNKIFDDSESEKQFPHCSFSSHLPIVKPDDKCENWESKKKLINVIKSLCGHTCILLKD
jgi:hypothetical protein